MKKIFTISALFILMIGSLHAQQSPGKDHSKLNITCKTCHTCDVPTKSDPCLVICPREKIATVYQKPEETPDLITIDRISDRYGPVYFSHKIHAQMSIMSGGCENCHHYNTSGPILKCNSCHESSRERDDISRPDLKGALHRQCMDCHREWSHETGCNTCHTLKKNVKGIQHEQVKKKLAGMAHPVLLEPTKIIFEANYEKGKMVTFFHDDHTKKFKIQCTSCHKNETCLKCHDVNKVTDEKSKIIKVQKSLDEHHKKCFSCHKDDKCGSCHLNKPAEQFDHGKKTGWALNKFHVNLSCVNCHGSKIPYSKLDNKCVSCHKEWNNENFKHTITGLQLNETHAQLNCEDCHAEKNFAIKPACTNCHENYIYPKQKPGKLVRTK